MNLRWTTTCCSGSAARLYGAGLLYSRQHLYAAYDMATSGTMSTDPLALWDTIGALK